MRVAVGQPTHLGVCDPECQRCRDLGSGKSDRKLRPVRKGSEPATPGLSSFSKPLSHTAPFEADLRRHAARLGGPWQLYRTTTSKSAWSRTLCPTSPG